ncbi:MAG: molybdopterin-dependent oxidoreductase [Mycobacteriales bacterium]
MALGVAELVAALLRPQASPLVTVGQTVIDATPTSMEQWAIRTFGSNDKAVLMGGILLVLAVFAAVLGYLASRYLPTGVAGVMLFGIVGIVAALSRSVSETTDILPAIAAAVAGSLAMIFLIRALPQREPVQARSSSTVEGTASNPPSGDGIEENTDTAADDSQIVTAKAAESVEPVRSPASPGYSRRGLLILGSALGVTAVATATLGRWLQGVRYNAAASREAVKLPTPVDRMTPIPAGAKLDVEGISSFVTPNADFYKVDTTLVVPQVRTQDWQLRIHGMVDRPITLTFDELLELPMIERMITMTCVSNQVGGQLLGNAIWLGVALGPLLKARGISPRADQLVCRSVDGMTIGAPLRQLLDGRDAMLAIGMNGEPLPFNNGFPARVVVPGLYGYCSACKWIVDAEVTTFDAFDTYWVKRDWAQIAPIKISARIDTPAPLSSPGAGRVNIAGIAWAQDRGISKVEISVDEGPWREAKLAEQVTIDVWRQWMFGWDATPGRHKLTVRATDGNGVTQVEQRVKPFPNGSSGWHNIVVTVS